MPLPVRRRPANGTAWIEERLEKGQLRQIRFGIPTGAWQLPERAANPILLDPDRHRMFPFFLTARRLLLFTNDEDLKRDFTDKRLIDNPPGKVRHIAGEEREETI